jgi:succinoglycan biosynthesis transport protein ExoP
MSTKKPAPSNSPTPLPFRSYLYIFWKRKYSILAIWLVATAIGTAIVLRLPAVYKAETLILVESQKIPEKLVSSTVNDELQDRLATISQEILSSTRLQKIIEQFNLYQDERRSTTQEEIVETMRKDITIKLERGWTRNQPGAFHVSYQGSNPETVAGVVNTIGGLFIEENLKSREMQAEGTAEFLGAQLQAAKKSLEEQEARLSQYKQAHAGELPEQENSLSNTLQRLQIELQGNQDAINRAQQNKIVLESALGIAEADESTANGPSGASDTVTPPGTVAGVEPASPANIKKSVQMAEELDKLKRRYTDNYPEVQELKAALERQRELEAREAASASAQPAPGATRSTSPVASTRRVISPELQRDLNARRERAATLRAQVAATNTEIQQRIEERKRILSDISGYQGRVEHIPVREQEMASVKRDYEISKSNYESLLGKNIAADMASDMEKRQKSERFTVLDTARVPEKPFKPYRILLSSLASAAGLLLAGMLAVGTELKRNTILGEWELPPDIVVLGRIPRITQKGLTAPAPEPGL